MKKKKEECAFVGENIYVVMLIQAVPGYEQDICGKFLKEFNEYDSHLYFSFSEFDIIAILKLKSGVEFDSLANFTHPKIRDFQQIVCYSYDEDKVGFTSGPALALTLLKFDEQAVTETGINIETEVRKLVSPVLEKSRHEVNGLLLGSLGWAEAILVQTGKNLQTLLSNVAEIAIDGHGYSALQISHTFPCVKRREPLDGEHELSFESVEGKLHHWRIAVSCTPRVAFSLLDDITKEDVGRHGKATLEVVATFGRRDLLVSPKPEAEGGDHAVNGLLSTLTLLRKKYLEYILSTHSDISILGQVTQTPTLMEISSDMASPIKEKTFRQKWLRRELRKLDIGLKRFSDWEDTRNNITLEHSSQLSQMVLRIKAIAATPGLEGVVDDLMEFVKATVRKANSQITRVPPVHISEYNREKYLELESMENVYFFGLEQRMAGARLGLGHPSQAYSNLQGLGIQRILRASKAIPYGLLSGISKIIAKRWWGFTIFGYRNDTFVLPNGAINLPYQDMLHPEEWWRLGHETGHAFGIITELVENPYLSKSIDKLDKDLVRRITGQEWATIVDALAVEVFEYLFCYRGDFDLYLRTTWRFFDHLLEGVQGTEKLKEYLLRSAFVYFFHLQVNGVIEARENIEDVILRGKEQQTLYYGNTSQALSYRAIAECLTVEGILIRAVLDKLDKPGILDKVKYAIRKVNLQDVVVAYKALEFFRGDFAELFLSYLKAHQYGKIKDLKELFNPNLEKELEDMGNKLNKGYVYTELRGFDLFKVPMSLQYYKNEAKKGNVPHRARVAAILSLWNADRLQQREKRDQSQEPYDKFEDIGWLFSK